MIRRFVDQFVTRKAEVEEAFREKHPDSYSEIVSVVVKIACEGLNPNRIHRIDDGNCQGAVIFVIPENCYEPQDYYYAKILYGSCSVCDTLKYIRNNSEGEPTSEQVNDYVNLAMHIVMSIKQM